MATTRVTVAKGDGIGPEIMDACLSVLQAAGADVHFDEVCLGEREYLSGNISGIEPRLWDSLRETKVLYKAPLTTPQGGGFKSVNVTIRKALGLFANIRPTQSLHPYVATKHPSMNVVIVRENEEDLYAGIEHQQTGEVVQCLKLMSRPGTERLCRFAFEYARANRRKKVTCFTKDNIMKLTDGMFHKVFDEVAQDYPDLENEHWIVDIGAAKLADSPENFDVIVLPNLYGDILSDVAAQIAGSVGMAGSANIGEHAAMFEAIHGSAPRRANQNLANPSGLLLAGAMMMLHLGKGSVAQTVHNAWLKTIEEGIHTYDIYREGVSKQKVGTQEFAAAVIARLGSVPSNLPAASYPEASAYVVPPAVLREPAKRELHGVDIFVYWSDIERRPEMLAKRLSSAASENLQLTMITNRGQKVWPDGAAETFCTDHWRCRFETSNGTHANPEWTFDLMHKIHAVGIEIIKTENLYVIDGSPAFSKGQGQ